MSGVRMALRRKHLDHLARHGFAFHPFWVGLRHCGPHSDLKTFHSQNILVEQPMRDAETAVAPLGYLRLNDHSVRKSRWRLERDSQVDQRNPHNLMDFEHLQLRQAGLPEQRRRACVEVSQVARVEDNLGGIAVAPFDVNRLSVG